MKKIKVCIIGTGNIGTDLMIKCLKIPYIELVAFVGRRSDSIGIKIAEKNGVFTSTGGIDFFKQNDNICDVVLDCTNAEDAIKNSVIFKRKNIKVIDLTPAKVGVMCVPYINSNEILMNDNVNMITCGGQSSLPLLNILPKFCNNISYIELVSQISSDSAGFATRINIDSYIETTQDAIKKFTGCDNCKVILNLNPAIPQVDMQTTVFAKATGVEIPALTDAIIDKIIQLKRYIPFYELTHPPSYDYDRGILFFSIKVKGAGDFLPSYAGNLDVINSAAIELIKILATNEQ